MLDEETWGGEETVSWVSGSVDPEDRGKESCVSSGVLSSGADELGARLCSRDSDEEGIVW